jgi:hypothetical protein
MPTASNPMLQWCEATLQRPRQHDKQRAAPLNGLGERADMRSAASAAAASAARGGRPWSASAIGLSAGARTRSLQRWKSASSFHSY